VTRAGSPLALRLSLLFTLGSVLDEHGDVPAAIGHLEEALRLLREHGADDPGSPLALSVGDVMSELGVAKLRSSDPEGALEALRQARAVFSRVLGTDHLRVSLLATIDSQAYADLGRNEEALAAMQEAVRISEARAPGSPLLARQLSSLGTAYSQLGRNAEALPCTERALAIGRAALEKTDPQLAMLLNGQALNLTRAERGTEAIPLFDEGIAILERLAVPTYDLGISLSNRADVLAADGRCDDAVPDYRRAVEIITAVKSATHASLVYPVIAIGECLYERGRGVDSIDDLERGLAIEAQGPSRPQVAWIHFQLGRVLVESKRDLGRGKQLVAQARTELGAIGGYWLDGVAEIDAWSRRLGIAR
jgi:tetratricopeptide (TPR) repeat protein